MNKIIFMGTPLIAKKTLELLKQKYEIILVVCQPDKKKNRNGKIVFNEVKQFCIEQNLPFIQPEKIGIALEQIQNLKPDLIVTCAYGQFIPDSILKIPKYGCVNLHASLLPKLRGGAPIQWAIINGFTETGWTLMYMNQKMDQGNIIKQYKLNIDPNKITYSELYQKLIDLMPEIINNGFDQLFQLNVISVAQKESEVTFGFNIQKSDRYINWNKTGEQILHLVNGLADQPLALTIYQNFELKIKKVSLKPLLEKWKTVKNGTIVQCDQNELLVKASNSLVQIEQLQLPNKKMLNFIEFTKGNHTLKTNTCFENLTTKAQQ